MTSLIRQKISFFHPHMTPGGMKVPNPYCTSTRQPNHVLEYLLSTFENVDVVQVTNFTEKKKSSFSTLINPREKMKIPKPYCTSTGHGQ